MSKNKVQHGAIIKILFDGKPVGRLNGFNPGQSWGLTGVYAIGNMQPYELVNLRFSGTWSASSFVIASEDVAQLKQVKTKGLSVAQAIRNFLNEEGFIIAVENKYTGKKIVSIAKAKLDSENYSFSENAIVGKNISGQFIEPMKN